MITVYVTEQEASSCDVCAKKNKQKKDKSSSPDRPQSSITQNQTNRICDGALMAIKLRGNWHT